MRLLLCLTILILATLAACAAPPAPATPTPAPSAPPVEESLLPGVTLPLTQPLASLVILDAGVITPTQTLAEGEETPATLPVQAAFALPVWAANGDHRHPLAVILPDAGRVCEANAAEEWPCPAALQRSPYPGLRTLAQGLALHGYMPLIVNLNGAYTPALDPDRQTERGAQIVQRLLAWLADPERQPEAEHYAGELNQSVDDSKIVLIGHGRGAEIALALADQELGEATTLAGLLLIAPELPAGAALPDLPISLVMAGCEEKLAAMDAVEAARGQAGRRSLLASVTVDGATANGFDAAAAAVDCGTGDALEPSQQQAWLAAYAADFADTATGHAPPYPAAGLDVLTPMPTTIHGLPATASVSDPGRPVQPGQITLFNLGEIVVEQPAPPPADRMPLRVEGTFILPEGEGPHPLVLWLHLRGSTCFGSAGLFESVWPCAPAAIPRYEMGYDYLLEALAEAGYAVAAPSLTGAFTSAPAWAPPGDSQAAALMDYYRVEPLVDRLLAELAAANRGQSLAFGQELTGKLDLDQLIFAGHSRGGEWANLLALRRDGNDTSEAIAAGRGPARGLFLLTPSHGDFVSQDPGTLRTADLPIAIVPAYCDDDLKEDPLMGQAFLEQALMDEERRAPAWVAALKTGEHYGFVTLTRGAFHNPSGTFCQDWDALLYEEAARAFLAALTPAFADVALGRQPAAAIPGFDPAGPLPGELYGAPIEITALDPARRRLVLLPASEAELSANRLGGAITDSGRATLSFCGGMGEQLCIEDEAVELRLNSPPDAWVIHQPQFAGHPPQARMQWDAPDGRLSLAIPAASGDLSGYATLHFRTLVDMFDPRNADLESQALRVALVDAAGRQASMILPPSEPALIRDRGERNSLWQWSQFPLRARSVRVPLSAFQGVDLTEIRSLDFIFDQTAQGSLLLSMVEFVTGGE